MAVKRFDPDDVLDRAIETFWQHGYEATSAQELVDAMGINRGSLYDTFGSKPELYRRALERYRQRATGELEAAMTEGDVLPALRRFLRAQAAQLTGDPSRRGCLLTNATTEMALRDPAVAELVQASLEDGRDVLRRALAEGQRSGAVRSDESPAALADFLLTLMQGMRVVGKADATRRRLDQVIDLAIGTLRPGPS